MNFLHGLTTTKQVFALGSCRLTTPIKRLHDLGKINFVNRDQHWYAHTAAEIRQRVEYMQGRRDLPAEVLPDLMDVDSCESPPQSCRTDLAMPSIGIFEISTRMENWRGDFHLHSTLVAKKNIVNVERRMASFEQMYDDLRKLADSFQHVILACNIAYNSDLRMPNSNRLQLNYALKSLAHEDSRFSVVDPNELISFSNPEQDLSDENHFHDPFVPRVATFYEKHLSKL